MWRRTLDSQGYSPLKQIDRGNVKNLRVAWAGLFSRGRTPRYGRIQATNLETRQTVFIKRERAPETSGILATAGGLIFSGSIDRWFSTHNDQTGEELWRIRLNDVPGSAPVTFEAGGSSTSRSHWEMAAPMTRRGPVSARNPEPAEPWRLRMGV